MNEITQNKSVDERIDELEFALLSNFKDIECPLTHRFTPGLYIREIFMPAGSIVISKIHKTEHPYIVSAGKVSVWTEEDKEILIEAPFTSITIPGTRRVLYCHTDVVWTTIHAITDGETVEQIEERIIEKHVNPLINNEDFLKFRAEINKIKEESCLTQL